MLKPVSNSGTPATATATQQDADRVADVVLGASIIGGALVGANQISPGISGAVIGSFLGLPVAIAVCKFVTDPLLGGK